MRRQSLAVEPALRDAIQREIARRIQSMPQFVTAHTIALFCSLADEVPTCEWLSQWGSTHRLVVPRVEGDVMQFYHYAPESMLCGAFNISEPQTEELCQPSDIDLIIVPAVAFTLSGCRLGRGRGYYDRYMSQSDFRAYKVGVCYPHQIVDALPVEPHDVCVDCVVSATR